MKTPSWAGMLSLSLSVMGLTVLASPAKAGSLTFDQTQLNLFNDSTPVNFNVTLDDTAAGAGKVQFKVDVADGFFADLRGIFFHLKDESLLADLSITGNSYITQVVKNANSVLDLGGGGGNIQGSGSKSGGPKSLSGELTSNLSLGSGGFDVGVEIGTQGTGKDDIRSATFVVSHATKALSLSDFAQQGFGVRMMSVGTSANSRDGSSKLTGIAPTLPPITIEQPKPEVPPVVTNPTPEQPQPETPPVVLPPVAVVPESPKPEEKPVEVPEPSTAFLALASIGAFKVLKKKAGQG